MKKRVITLVLAVFVCFVSVIPAFAIDGFDESSYRVFDDADLITTEEWHELLSKIDEIRERQKFDIAIMTTTDTDYMSLQEFADYIYDYYDYGYGENLDGILLVIGTEANGWYITTSGYGITAFTDAGIQYIGEQMSPYFANDDYIGAFNVYLEKCDELITMAKNGTPYGSTQDTSASDDKADKPLSLIWIPISIAIGVVVAIIVVKGMKSDLKSVRKKKEANSYVRNGSLFVNENYDTFLYSQVTKTVIQKQNNSGSSTHTSSSGNTHGGGGGSL